MFAMYGEGGVNEETQMSVPENCAPIGNPGPFGIIEMGGMFSIVKVREQLVNYADPGWYQHPPGTVAEPVPQNLTFLSANKGRDRERNPKTQAITLNNS
jgi:hypothetical protein